MEKEYINLNKEQSAAIKGLLIFLIVLGHNAVFTNSVPGSFGYLYTFHVQAFFILPFLYKTKMEKYSDSIKKDFARLYYPYIIFFILLSIICYFMQGSSIDTNGVIDINATGIKKILLYISTILTGNFYLIDYFSGFQYLWFLPVMFSMSVIRKKERKKERTLMVIGLICYIIFFVFMYGQPYKSNINYILMLFSPFAILQGCGAFFLGKASFSLMNNDKSRIINIICTILFVTLSVTYIVLTYCDYMDKISQWCFRFIMPILFINLLYLYKDFFARFNLLKKLGNNSFPIYLIHPMLCTIAYLICERYLSINVVYAIIIQIAVVFISYYTSVLWQKITPLRKKTLPRSLDEIYN